MALCWGIREIGIWYEIGELTISHSLIYVAVSNCVNSLLCRRIFLFLLRSIASIYEHGRYLNYPYRSRAPNQKETTQKEAKARCAPIQQRASASHAPCIQGRTHIPKQESSIVSSQHCNPSYMQGSKSQIESKDKQGMDFQTTRSFAWCCRWASPWKCNKGIEGVRVTLSDFHMWRELVSLFLDLRDLEIEIKCTKDANDKNHLRDKKGQVFLKLAALSVDLGLNPRTVKEKLTKDERIWRMHRMEIN